jgi:transcriptional regulator GlxA family with amidase domain
MKYFKKKKVLLDLCVAQLLVHISEQFSRQLVRAPAHPELLTRMLLWLQIHYAGNVTLTTLADHFRVSKAYTARLFRKHLSTTVTTYINELRLHHATELLRLSTMNISQIAAGVGFSNVYYFSRLFQQYFHISPSAYRRQGCL